MAGVSLFEVNDPTGLDEDRIDVPARLAWVTQMARTTAAPAYRCSRATLSARMTVIGHAVSASRLARLERGERRGDLYDAYEQALRLQPGQLRIPVDTLCRTFSYSPADLGARLPLDVDLLSSDYDALAEGRSDGGTWVRWARALGRDDAMGFPTRLLDPLLDALISQTGRACGVGYLARYEALTRLRSGPYHQAVLRAARRAVEDRDVQVVFDLFSAVSDHPTPEGDTWLAECLGDPRPQVVQGACIAIPNAASVAGWDTGAWAGFVGPLREALGSAAPESRAILENFWHQLPPELRADGAEAPTPRERRQPRFASLEENPLWRLSRRLSDRITNAAGIESQPMLTRLLYEVAFDQREHRAVTAYHLLIALPFLDHVVEVLLDHAATEQSAVSTRILGRVAQMRTGLAPASLHRIGPGGDAVREAWRLVAHAYAGVAPPREDVLPLLGAHGRPQRLAVLTLGLSAHPLLDELRVGPDAALAGAARWWAEHGPLVRDTDHAYPNEPRP